VKRISVGVIVNSDLEGVKTEEIERIVAAAAGLDVKRGDTLSVVAIPFRKPPLAPEEVAPVPLWQKFLIPAVAGVILSLLLLFGLLRFLRRKPAPAPVEEVARKEPRKVAALLKMWLREE